MRPIWVDAQISPGIARWVRESLRFECVAVRDLGLRDATDREIWGAAAKAGAIVLTKDRDFWAFSGGERGAAVIWLTCGNTSNARLREILLTALPKALDLIDHGEGLVEIRD